MIIEIFYKKCEWLSHALRVIMGKSEEKKVLCAWQIESYTSQGPGSDPDRRTSRGRGSGWSSNAKAFREEGLALEVAQGRSKNPYIAMVAPPTSIEVIPLTSIYNQESLSKCLSLPRLQNASNKEIIIDPFNIKIDFFSPSIWLPNAS